MTRDSQYQNEPLIISFDVPVVIESTIRNFSQISHFNPFVLLTVGHSQLSFRV